MAESANIGRYTLIESIGAGGMGEVFRARASGLGRAERQVAIKMVHAHLAHEREVVELFHREVQVASTLAHPNLVTVHESGTYEGRCYLAMEYVDGVDLRTLLRRVWQSNRAIPVGVAISICAAACAGLHHAHERRDPDGRPLEIVHRDVSPGNILLSRDGAVKVGDFGVAKAQASWTTVHSSQGTIRGKLSYMAPEQAQGATTDRRADVFAVGTVLFEMLAGHRPIQGGNEVEMLHALVFGSPPDVRDSRPDCPPALAELVDRALQRDPHERFATALDMQRALEACALDEGCFVPPSALAEYFERHVWAAQASGAEPEEAATTRVRDTSVAPAPAAPSSPGMATETVSIGGSTAPTPAPSTAGRSRARGRWLVPAVLGIGVAAWGGRSLIRSEPAATPSSHAEIAAPATGSPRTLDAEPAAAEPSPSRDLPSAPAAAPATEQTLPGPESSESPPPAAHSERRSKPSGRRARRRSGSGKARKSSTAPTRSKIDPGESLFPIDDK